MGLIISNVPMELRSKNQWVGWSMINGRKVPMCSKTSKAAQSSNPETWGSFTEAVRAYKENNWAGIGFVFNKDYVGIDLDHCIENNEPNSFAKEVLAKCNSYTEYSPSGSGLHIIAKGEIPKSLRTDKIEIYNTGRYFTVTGRLLYGRRIVKTVDVASFYPTDQSTVSTSDRLQQLKSGNVDNTLTSLAGSLFKKGFGYTEVFLFLKEKANKAGHDDEALHRICRSVERYHPREERYGISGIQSELDEQKPVEIYTPSTHSAEFLRRLDDNGKGVSELTTGFPTIDSYTGGLKKGSIWVVGARTGIGKTSFSITVANNLLKQNKKVLLFSTEMDWVDAFGRFASIGTGISLHTLTNARRELTGEDRARLSKYADDLKSKSLYVVEEPEPSLRVVSEEISRVRPDVFIFDHIQRVSNSRDQRYLELAKFIKGLNTLCRQNNCAGIVNSQLNRIAEHEPPALSHLKECGALEEEAHCVILLSAISVAPTAEAIILADVAKNRGPKGKVELRFDPVTAKFMEHGL